MTPEQFPRRFTFIGNLFSNRRPDAFYSAPIQAVNPLGGSCPLLVVVVEFISIER